MSKIAKLDHRFLKSIPRGPDLETGILYISLEYLTMIHLCACGCGKQVATPLSPNDWSMTFNGQSISVSPSIGNWSFPCRSHYFIRKNRIQWAGNWSDAKIEHERAADLERRRGKKGTNTKIVNQTSSSKPETRPKKHSFYRRFLMWFFN